VSQPQINSLMSVDRVVHEPARLIILSILSGAEQAEFKLLESMTGLSKGNLSSHIAKLEEARYVEVSKSFRDKFPLTTLRITKQGRSALKSYRQQIATALRTSS
jgi:DNA-binding MarR family transcriptional regulator